MNESLARLRIKFLAPNPPGFGEEEVRRIAAEVFGLEGDLVPLVGERDQNFRISTAGGEDLVLKIANADEDPGVVDFQIRALGHIARVDPGLAVPRVRPTLSGEASAMVSGSNGARHSVRSVTYLSGRDLESVALVPDLLRNLGATAARLGKALRGFHHPSARHELLWDLRQLEALGPHIHFIADRESRATVERIHGDLARNLLPALDRLRAQVVHNDANGQNVIVDPAAPQRVCGVIDFGDMVHTALAADLAVSAADLLDSARDLDLLCELVAGYDAVVPLEEEEVDLLYDLILARHVITAIIVAWRGGNGGGAGHLDSHGDTSLAAMDGLLSLGRDRLRGRLRAACRFPPYCPTQGEAVGPEVLEELVARRNELLGGSLELSYQRPVHLLRGEGTWLFAADGSRLLDAHNNVPQVGHCHPQVVRAIARQAAALNTNTRYLYGIILDYAERLAATLPERLDCCLFVNSGGEANDAAWRMAKAVTGAGGALIMEEAYHGATDAIDGLSPEVGGPSPSHVRCLVAPDPYRGPYRHGETDLAARYAADAGRAIAELAETGLRPAAFMIDSAFTSNGILEAPAGYLRSVAEAVRTAGGLIIADEVQCGLGRFGSHFWGFEAHGLKPDLVTLGKPVANGYPLGVVIASRELRDRFGEASEFFSTFGGNPPACAAGLAVLDVIEREGLMANARDSGAYLKQQIRALMPRHAWIGDVRGRGLLLGVELVRDQATLEPAAEEARRVVDRMREDLVLVGRHGPHGNVIKIRPPLVFGRAEADLLVAALDRALAAL